MKKFWSTKTLLIIIALCLVALVAILFLGKEEGLAPELEDGNGDTGAVNPAPDFTVYDTEGNLVNLSDFAGKPVVLNFWASWCGPCKSEMPAFEAVYAELGDQVHFVMVNCTDGTRETVHTAQAFIAQQSYTFPIYFEKDSSASYAYGVRGIPTTFFIDAQGNLVAQATGAIDETTLREGIDRIT